MQLAARRPADSAFYRAAAHQGVQVVKAPPASAPRRTEPLRPTSAGEAVSLLYIYGSDTLLGLSGGGTPALPSAFSGRLVEELFNLRHAYTQPHPAMAAANMPGSYRFSHNITAPCHGRRRALRKAPMAGNSSMRAIDGMSSYMSPNRNKLHLA